MADGILPIRLHQPKTRPAFKQRVTIAAANHHVLDARSDTPRVVVPPAVFPPVELTITVNAPDGSLMEQLSQTLTVAVDMSGARTLVPTSASTKMYGAISMSGHPPYPQTVAQWKGRLHPRLSLTGPSGHEFPTLTVDLTFVDASYYLARLKEKDVTLSDIYNRMGTRAPKRPHHGCTLHAFEFTRTEGPATWLAIVPPSLSTAVHSPLWSERRMLPQVKDRGASAFDVLIHLRSIVRGDRYDAIEKTHGLSLLGRFFDEPDLEQPFFGGSQALWNSGPEIGFEQQLVKSGKSVIVAYPWPSVLDYGVLLTAGGPRMCAEALILALRATGSIAAGHALDVKLGRLGLAGYSGGGNKAIKVWLGSRSSIDELWLFDPQSFQFDQGRAAEGALLLDAATNVRKELVEWFKDPRRILRLIGGLQHPAALQIADRLDKGWKAALERRERSGAAAPRVWCKPATRAFRLGKGDDAIYSWAFLPLPPKGKPDAETLAAHRLTPGGKPPSALTTETGLELVDESNPDRVRVHVIALKRDADFPASHAELAGFLRTLWVPDHEPLSIEKDLWKLRRQNRSARVSDAKTVAALKNLVEYYLVYGRDEKHRRDGDPAWGVRHQWVPCGGERDPTRGEKFEGYYYLCLRDSGFS
jgi:hypothetical protein